MDLVANLHYLIHWPTHGGYNFVSGPLADITLITAFVGTLYLWLRKHNLPRPPLLAARLAPTSRSRPPGV
jgi:hypothetical protein